MKRFIAALVTLCFTSQVFASQWDALNALDRAPRAMLYFKVPLGSTPGPQSQMRFGLRLDKNSSDFGVSPLDFRPLDARSYERNVSLADFSFTSTGEYRLGAGGMVMFDSMDGVIGTTDSWSAWWWWVMLGAAAGLLSCATDNWPCDDDGSGYSPPGETPGG